MRLSRVMGLGALLVPAGCGAPEAPSTTGLPADTPTPSEMDSGGDSASGTSTSDSADTAPPGEDSSPPCSAGLTVTVDGHVAEALSFGEAPSRADARVRDLALRNDCPGALRFLGHPDDWLSGSGVTLEALPPVALLAGESASLALRWTPGAEGAWSGTLTLPHDGPDSPLALPLTATATAPLALVLAGDGAHLLATRDYGVSAALDAWSTTEAHTRALIRGVCAGPTGFLAVGGNAERAWWTSPDGLVWTAHEEPGGFLGGCAWLDGRFVAFDGAPLWSLDGRSWTRGSGSTAAHLRDIVAGTDPEGRALGVAVGDRGGIALTRDGATWSSTLEAVTAEGLRHVAFGGGVFVAAGDSGRTGACGDGGRSWVAGSTGGGGVQGLVWSGASFLLGDGTSVYRSVDGVAWTRVNAARPAPVAVVGQQVFGVLDAQLWVSEDAGFSWTQRLQAAGGLGFSAGAAVEVRP